MGHLYHGELLNNQRVAWFKHQSWNFTKQNWGWKCCWIRNSREFISVKRMIPWENWWFNRPGNYPNLCGLSLKGNSCRKKKCFVGKPWIRTVFLSEIIAMKCRLWELDGERGIGMTLGKKLCSILIWWEIPCLLCGSIMFHWWGGKP